MPNPNLARSSCLTSSRSTSWRATSSASKNLADGTISRRHSQKVLLPVEIPPVIPIAGISAEGYRVAFFPLIRARQYHPADTVLQHGFMKVYEQAERNIHQLHIAEELGFAIRMQCLNCLQLYEQIVIHKHVKAQRLIEDKAFIFDADNLLCSTRN